MGEGTHVQQHMLPNHNPVTFIVFDAKVLRGLKVKNTSWLRSIGMKDHVFVFFLSSTTGQRLHPHVLLFHKELWYCIYHPV